MRKDNAPGNFAVLGHVPLNFLRFIKFYWINI